MCVAADFYGLMCVAADGYVAARVARRLLVKHAAAMGIIQATGGSKARTPGSDNTENILRQFFVRITI